MRIELVVQNFDGKDFGFTAEKRTLSGASRGSLPSFV